MLKLIDNTKPGLKITTCNQISFSYFSTKTYVVVTQKNHLNEMVLFSTQTYIKTDGSDSIHNIAFIFCLTAITSHNYCIAARCPDKRCLSHGMYQVMMSLHFMNDGVNDIESTQKSINTSLSLV